MNRMSCEREPLCTLKTNLNCPKLSVATRLGNALGCFFLSALEREMAPHFFLSTSDREKNVLSATAFYLGQSRLTPFPRTFH